MNNRKERGINEAREIARFFENKQFEPYAIAEVLKVTRKRQWEEYPALRGTEYFEGYDEVIDAQIEAELDYCRMVTGALIEY